MHLALKRVWYTTGMVTRSGSSTIVLLALLAVALAGYLVPVKTLADEGDCGSG